MSTLPKGMFFRPVGPYAYCLRLVEVNQWGQWSCERWGMRDKLPFDDGHVNKGHYLNDMLEVLPGVFRDALRYGDRAWGLSPVYWRRIESSAPQLELFQ